MILVMGLSKTGISICEYLDDKNICYAVYDNDENKIESFKSRGVLSYTGDDLIDASKIDLVVKSPGFAPHESHVKALSESGVKIITDIEFFYREFDPKNIIAITGTNGKTTVTRMIGELLKNKHAKVAGNIGTPIMELQVNKDDVFVFELSSFQLNDIDKFKPSIALLLNIEEDHLDWHENFENYKNAKFNIFKNQDKNDFLIIDSDRLNVKDIKAKSKILTVSLEDKNANAYFDGNKIKFNFENHNFELPIEKIKYKQKHNISNLSAAIIAAVLMGAEENDIDEFLKSFKLDPHRMESFLIKDGIEYIDDSKATNPSAVVMAMKNYDNNTVLILGGYDKGTDFSEIFKTFPNIKMYLLEGGIKEKLKNTADECGVKNYRVFDNLKEATVYACGILNQGDKLILSPGASSFDEFKGYSERGEKFQQYVRELVDEK